MSSNTLGALLMVASMAAFTMNDTFMKLSLASVPFYQLICIRSFVTCALIVALWGRIGTLHFRIAPRDWGLIALRAGSEVVIAYFFLSALFNMPLANLTSIMQVVPLAVTLASALFLGEAVGWRRFTAIAIGFFGVLLIVKPGAEGFTIWSLYALIAVVGVAFRDLVTRRLSPLVPGMTVTLMTALAVMLAFGAASLGDPWQPVPPLAAGLIAGSAICVLCGYSFSIQVMRVADVSFTAPFRYTGLVWALVLGWYVFGEWPRPLTLAGAAIVVATGIFSLYRERRVAAD